MAKADSPYCNCLYYSSNALGRVMTKMAEEEFATTGLAPSYAFLLLSVKSDPGISPGAISEKMQLTPSTVTRLIEKMEVRGYLERKSAGRAVEVYLTTEGVKLIPGIKKAWRSLYRRYADLLGEENARQLTVATYEASKQLGA